MSLASLVPYGHREADLREHSLDWLRRLGEQHRRWLRGELADQLAMNALAASAPHSEEAGDQVQEVLAELRSEEEATPASHITDPQAETDWEALKPFLNRQPKEESSNGRQG